MYYVCLENNLIVSILNYKPEVPSTVQVVSISDEDGEAITNQSHYFDIELKKVLPVDGIILNQKNIDLKNAVEREYLNSTDWLVLRHIRQKYLEIPTSLSEEEFKKLETKRHEAASRII
jgi:hypothetical protein